MEFEKLKDPHLLSMGLGLLSEELKMPEFGSTHLKLHQQQCRRPSCFCKDAEYQARPDFLLRHHFQRVAVHFSEIPSLTLRETYIRQQLEEFQAANAINYLAHWRPSNFFEAVARLRCEAQVDAVLTAADSCNDYEREYSYAMQYDNCCMHLAEKIDEILKLKISFWMEASKEEPPLSHLQDAGLQIVKLSHNLNRFFTDTFADQ
jgi:hypothetical protein